MNIAHILSSFAIGGQERVALDLARGQRQLGHRVIAVSLAPPPDGQLAADFVAHGVATFTVPKASGFDLRLPMRLAEVLRAQSIDIVHTHNPQPLIYGTLAARAAGALLVHTKHGANPDGGRKLWMRRAAGHLAAAYVAVSSTTAAIARRNRECPESRLHVIDNGIDLSRFAPDAAARAAIREELGIPSRAWIIGTVGRLAPEKAYPSLIEAAARSLGEDVRLLIVGDGAERARIEGEARRHDVTRFVHLLGARKDVPRLLAAFDVFALSSTTEGLPLVIPEAMATALPVVSTAVGGIPNVVRQGETGLLVPARDPSALAAALCSLRQDRARAATLGRTGRTVALRNYSAERMVDDYLSLYARVSPSATLRGVA